MSHTASGQTVNYTWDVASPIPVVLKDNTYTYVYGLDLISATDSSGNQNYYMHNGLGSVTNIVDYAGNDDFRDFDSRNDDPRTTIHRDDGSCRNIHASFKESVERINSANIRYELMDGPNSNTVVRYLLENAGMDPDIPKGDCSIYRPDRVIAAAFGKKCGASAPGWGSDMFAPWWD
jgi:hypothetical protein